MDNKNNPTDKAEEGARYFEMPKGKKQERNGDDDTGNENEKKIVYNSYEHKQYPSRFQRVAHGNRNSLIDTQWNKQEEQSGQKCDQVLRRSGESR